MKKILVVFACFTLLFSACGGKIKSGDLSKVESGEIQFARVKSGDLTAKIETDKGDIKILLFPKYAPKAVENFKLLAQAGEYDNTVFHRVIKDFIVGGGSPDGSADGGKSRWDNEFSDEFSDVLHNYTGALSMANHGEDTNGSQFFFVVTPVGNLGENDAEKMTNAGWREEVIETYKQAGGLPSLDYRYTVFGQVYEGMDVLYKIANVKTDENHRPTKDIKIKSITFETVR
jgi:peptidyl-prolyl cis-trans isomerase B (cyclophilin B)